MMLLRLTSCSKQRRRLRWLIGVVVVMSMMAMVIVMAVIIRAALASCPVPPSAISAGLSKVRNVAIVYVRRIFRARKEIAATKTSSVEKDVSVVCGVERRGYVESTLEVKSSTLLRGHHSSCGQWAENKLQLDRVELYTDRQRDNQNLTHIFVDS
ncbi:hypothetical protein MRB53_039761 [Persea americana]|nr:hypothetical protein MRB53_039761 [Persea americana]